MKAIYEMTNEELLDVLANDQSYHKRRAASTLGKRGDMRAFHLVLRMFEEEPHAALATALGNFGDTQAVEPLIQALQEQIPTTQPERKWKLIDRYYYVRALGKLGDERALPILAQVFNDETEPVLKGKSVSDMAAKAIARIQKTCEL